MTDTPQNTVPCLKARMAALAQLVASQREAIDRERRLTRPGFKAIAEAAAALDGSIGWVVGNGGGMGRAHGYLPEAVARP